MASDRDVRYLTPPEIELKKFKYCRFRRARITHVDYKDSAFLLKMLNEQGKLLPRRITGTTLKFQRKVSRSVKRARQLALLPYVADNMR